MANVHVVYGAPGKIACRREQAKEVQSVIANILKGLLPDQNGFSVDVSHGERTTIFKIDCSRDNIGYLIGRQGKTIDSLRKIVLAMTTRYGFRSVIEIPYYAKEEE